MMDKKPSLLPVKVAPNDYEAEVNAGGTDPHPYDRLMIAYRKAKQYADELRIVKKAIAVFEQQLQSLQNDLLKGHRKRSQIMQLSQSISKQAGLVDKTGKAIPVPEPIARRQKRLAVIEKKLAATTKEKTPAKKRKNAKKYIEALHVGRSLHSILILPDKSNSLLFTILQIAFPAIVSTRATCQRRPRSIL